MEASYQTADAAQSTRYQLSMPTLALGAVATVATTVSVTLLATADGGSQTAHKFAPAQPAAVRGSKTAMNIFGRSSAPASKPQGPPPFDILDQEGILPPVGYLDPLGFGEKASPERLRWFREAELKHGRVAMLA